MSQLQLDTENPASPDGVAVDTYLKSLWDKIRSVVELVAQLRSDNASLQEQNEQLNVELQRTKVQFEEQLSSLHRRHETEVNALNNRLAEETSSLKSFYENEISKLRSSSDSELLSTKAILENTLREVRGQLEAELTTTRGQLSTRDQDMKRLRAEYSQIVNANENVAFTKEEKEILRNRIRELIAKINSHL